MIIVRSQWGRYNLPRCLFDPGIRIPRTPSHSLSKAQRHCSGRSPEPSQSPRRNSWVRARSGQELNLRVKKHGAILISDQFRWKIQQHFVFIRGWAGWWAYASLWAATFFCCPLSPERWPLTRTDAAEFLQRNTQLDLILADFWIEPRQSNLLASG